MEKNRLITIAGLVVVFILLIVFYSKKSDFNKIKEVDFDQVVIEHKKVVDKESKDVLRVAVGAMISPEATREYYNDLLRLIGNKLNRKTVFMQRKTYSEVNDLVERNEVDIAFVCSGPYVEGKKKFGMEILTVPVVHGEPVYYSYILVNKNSSIEAFDDLRNKKFVFVDPDSNTGCIVPKYIIENRGEKAETFFKDFYYSYSHDKSIQAVAEGSADGAAVDSLIWDYFSDNYPEYTSKTKIITKSEPYGIPPVVVNPNINPLFKEEIKQVFLSLNKEEDGASILKELHIEKFIEGKDSDYNSVRDMLKVIKDKKGN